MSEDFDEAYAGEQIRRRSSLSRSVVKYFYLRNLLRTLTGPTIDLGCGAGQLLERLPQGSLGLETNPHLVAYLSNLDLEARFYDLLVDDCALSIVEPGRYVHLVCAHVIEHFEDPASVLRKLAAACERLGIGTMTFVVPGARGFRSDSTHKTFVTAAYIDQHNLRVLGPFELAPTKYFPVNMASIGRWFVYHECILTWHRA